MLGGAWVSMRAQADDTKSPRERQFMNQMIGLRLIGVLVLAGVFYGIGQLGVTSSALTGDIWRAAFLFAVCLVAKIFFVYGSRRQREIQIEDKTYAADEWRLPRKTTDARAAAAGNPSTSRLMTIRFMAFGLVMSVVMSSQAPWQSDWVKSAALSAMWVLVLYVGYRGWQNRPRYLSLQANWVVLAPVVMALITLFTVNLHQYGLQGGPTPELAASTATMLIFNLAVVLAYATFMAVLVWQRRRECR
jgi:MFS family permease